MSNLQNRTRVIYFRVSEKEFQKISDLSERRGARNISDFVRSVLETTSLEETAATPDMHLSIERLEFVVERLTGVLSQMTDAQRTRKLKESPNGSDPS